MTPLPSVVSLALNDTVCLNYAQMSFIMNKTNAVLYQFGLFMLVMGLIFGAVIGISIYQLKMRKNG